MNKILELLNDARLKPTTSIKEEKRMERYGQYLAHDTEQTHLSLAALIIISEQRSPNTLDPTTLDAEVGFALSETIMDNPPTHDSLLPKIKRLKKEQARLNSLDFLSEAISNGEKLYSLIHRLNYEQAKRNK